MFGQGTAWPWTRACLGQGEGARGPSPSRIVGAATASTEGATHGEQGVAHRCRGLTQPVGTSGRGPLWAWVCIIWHGRLICSVVGSAIVRHPRRPVSLKIGPQIQIQIQKPSLPPTLPFPPSLAPSLSLSPSTPLQPRSFQAESMLALRALQRIKPLRCAHPLLSPSSRAAFLCGHSIPTPPWSHRPPPHVVRHPYTSGPDPAGEGGDLEAALAKAAEDSTARPAFQRLLLESEIFVPTAPGAQLPPVGETVLSEPTTIALQTVQHEGKSYLPFYTSLRALQDGPVKADHHVRLSCRAFFEGATIPVVLNPGLPHGAFFSVQEVAALLQGGAATGPAAVTIPKGSKMMVGVPAHTPQSLMDRLSGHFADVCPSVRRACVGHAVMCDAAGAALPPGRTIVAIEFESGTGEEELRAVIAGLNDVVQPEDILDPPLDVMPYTEGKTAGVIPAFLDGGFIEPFYVRL